jgi:hypothetical protein
MFRAGAKLFIPVLMFVVLSVAISWSAENNTFKLKPLTAEQTQTLKPDRMVVTAGASIIKGESIKSSGRKYLDADLIVAVLKSIGINSSFDISVMAFAIEKPAAAAEIKLPSTDPNGNLTVVIGGNILKTESVLSNQKAFINFRFVENLLKGFGYDVKFDASSNFITVTDSKEALKTAEQPVAATPDPAAASIPEPASSPAGVVTSPQPAAASDKITDKDVKAIAAYMNSLKKIFDDNAPEKSANGGSPDPTAMKGEDLKPVIERQKKIIADINKLTPPEEQTGDIHKAALGVMAKMLRATELSLQIFSLPEGRRKPSAEEEVLELNRQITEEQKEFNRKVILLREKYNLGRP